MLGRHHLVISLRLHYTFPRLLTWFSTKAILVLIAFSANSSSYSRSSYVKTV